jgi:hypothetical protein
VYALEAMYCPFDFPSITSSCKRIKKQVTVLTVDLNEKESKLSVNEIVKEKRKEESTQWN